MDVPELWIMAGPNGAGKTTCVQKEPISSLLSYVKFYNPDDRTLMKLRSSGYQNFADSPADLQARLFIEAAKDVAAELQDALSQGLVIGVETVMSTDKYLPIVESVRARGGIVGLIYVALSSSAISIERVTARVLRGGHGVPPAKIVQRWHRSLDFLARFAGLANVFWVFDNSESTPGSSPRMIASGKDGILEFLSPNVFPEMRAALAALPFSSEGNSLDKHNP